jgi:peptidyl-prolyl cis-trans isomerase SurA
METRFACLAFALVVSALGMAQPAHAQRVAPLDSIVAVVEEDVILESQLEAAIAPIRQQLAASGNQMPPENVLRRQVLERLITRELQVQRASQTGIRISDAELDNAVAMIARQNSLSPAELRRTVEADGMSFAQLRDELRKELTVQNLQRRVAETEVNVSDTEIEIALASAEAGDDSEFRLSHILVSVAQGASTEQIEAAEARVQEVMNELQGSMAFERAAITYSDGQNALEGGDLGWRALDEVPPSFAEAISATPDGEVIGPIRSPSGFHLLRVEEKRDERVRKMTEQNARHILVEIDELTTSSQALRQAQEARARIVDLNEPFGAVAREMSDDPQTNQLGGEMDWFPKGVYGERVDEVMSTLEENEISQPFRSERGWHILQYLGERERDVTDEMRRQRVSDSIRERKAEEAVSLWVRQLRDESYVDIRIEDA